MVVSLAYQLLAPHIVQFAYWVVDLTVVGTQAKLVAGLAAWAHDRPLVRFLPRWPTGDGVGTPVQPTLGAVARTES